MAKKTKTKTRSGGVSRRRSASGRASGGGAGTRLFRGVVRVFAWWLLAVFLVVSAWGVVQGFYQLFFVHNPHFTLESLVVDVYGDVRETQVSRLLEEHGVVLNQSNLFELDIEKLRESFYDWEVPVKMVRISRRLPGTLIVQVFEHEPMAQLRRPGHLLVDSHGIVLPGRERRSVHYLPLITPVKGGDLVPGMEMEDELVEAALYFIVQVNRERDYSDLFDIRLIRLDYESGERFTVHLGARGPFCEGAQVVLPVDHSKMDKALKRVRRIARERLKAEQMTGFIDATYEVNIPVRKRP
jgi:hypothetical protein